MSGRVTPNLREAQSVREALQAAGVAFAAAGISDAQLEARDLLLFIMGIDRAALPSILDAPLSELVNKIFKDAVARRLAGTPLDRIMGEREFMGRLFSINADTLSPREDTAAVVELARHLVENDRPLRMLDLGTGSGILLVTLLAEFPSATGIGTDLADGALRAAAENAAHLGVAPRAEFIKSDWFESIEGQFDLIVSNPPYIETAVIASLEREVRAHDPHLALDGGVDGLGAYRAIGRGAAQALAPGGALIVEIGQGQSADVCTLFLQAGLTPVATRNDLSGIERALAFQRDKAAPSRL